MYLFTADWIRGSFGWGHRRSPGRDKCAEELAEKDVGESRLVGEPPRLRRPHDGCDSLEHLGSR